MLTSRKSRLVRSCIQIPQAGLNIHGHIDAGQSGASQEGQLFELQTIFESCNIIKPKKARLRQARQNRQKRPGSPKKAYGTLVPRSFYQKLWLETLFLRIPSVWTPKYFFGCRKVYKNCRSCQKLSVPILFSPQSFLDWISLGDSWRREYCTMVGARSEDGTKGTKGNSTKGTAGAGKFDDLGLLVVPQCMEKERRIQQKLCNTFAMQMRKKSCFFQYTRTQLCWHFFASGREGIWSAWGERRDRRWSQSNRHQDCFLHKSDHWLTTTGWISIYYFPAFVCWTVDSTLPNPARNAQRILSQRLKNELEVKQEVKEEVEEVKIESSDDERRAWATQKGQK